MRLITLAYALLLASQLVGCSPSSRESQFTEIDSSPNVRLGNPDLLSPSGELFPLSTFFGVCVRHANILRSTYNNGMPGPHFPTYAVFTGAGGDLKITVGKFGMWPDVNLKDVPATSPHRRIQIGQDRFHSFVLVSDFGSKNNRVSIDYDANDASAKAEAIRLANNVVACHVSTALINTKDEEKK